MRFEIDKDCAVLERFHEDAEARSELEPLRGAALALHFLAGSGHQHNLEDLLACFESDAPPGARPSFATREQALEWLRRTPAPDAVLGLTIAERRYTFGASPDAGEWFLIRVPSSAELSAAWPDASGLVAESVAFLVRALARVTSADERESLQVSLLALHFIENTGLSSDFERFAGLFDTQAPMHPLRAFASRAEAERWLSAHPRPPHGARVQIGEERFSVGHDRASGLRVLLRGPALPS